jgi:tetratricopeptide (TPR) repeat protein
MLTQDLSVLETRGLVRVTTDESKPVVRFKHALTREATYNSILQSRRAELHCVVARVLAETHPQLDLELVLSIAEHQLYCRDDASMVDFLLPFASRLIYTGRSTSLTRLLTQADRGALTESQLRDVDMALADAHAARGEYAAARELYESVLAYPLSEIQRAQLLHSLGAAAYHLQDNERAIEYQRAGLALAQDLGDIKLQARTSGGLGLAYWNLGDYTHAQEYLMASRALGEQIGNSSELANAEYGLAGIYLDRSDFRLAMQYAERALQRYEQFGHSTLAVRALHILGACYYGLKDLTQAQAVYERSIHLSRELGDRIALALGLGNLAEVFTDRDELDNAVLFYADSIRELRTLEYASLLGYYLTALAGVEIRQARTQAPESDVSRQLLETAQTHVDEAMQIARQLHSPENEGVALRVLAELYAARGDRERARSYARQAVVLLEPLGRALELERARQVEQEIRSAIQ